MRVFFLMGLILAGVLGSATLMWAQTENQEGVRSENLVPPTPPPIPLTPGATFTPPTSGEERSAPPVSAPQPPLAPAAGSPLAPAAGPPKAPTPPRPLAQTAPVDSIFPDSANWRTNFIGALGAFIVVLVLLLLFLRLIGRLGRGRGYKGGESFVLRGTMALDSRRYLAAVEIDGRLLVVGVTPDRLTALGQWSLDAEDEPFQDLPPEPAKFEAWPTTPKQSWPKKTAPVKAPSPKRTPPTPEAKAPDQKPLEPKTEPKPIASKPIAPEPIAPEPKPAPQANPDFVALGPEIIATPPRVEAAVSESLPGDLDGGLDGGLDLALEPNWSPEPRILGPSDDEPGLVGDDDPLDFPLTLDEEPFVGPETNDEFISLMENDQPPKRR